MAVLGSYPDASVADPTASAATAHGESQDHHSRGDDCDRDPEDGSTKNSLHDGRPCRESGQSRRITGSPINTGASRDWFAHFADRCARVATRIIDRRLQDRRSVRAICAAAGVLATAHPDSSALPPEPLGQVTPWDLGGVRRRPQIPAKHDTHRSVRSEFAEYRRALLPIRTWKAR